MATPKRKPTRARKTKGKVRVRQRAKIVKKGTETAKYDTIPTPLPRNNAATFRVKIKKKQ